MATMTRIPHRPYRDSIEAHTERVTIGRTTTMAYPLDHALRAARSGGLFAFHLVSEAKVVFETEPILRASSGPFGFRDDYTPVIRMCSEAGCFCCGIMRGPSAHANSTRQWPGARERCSSPGRRPCDCPSSP